MVELSAGVVGGARVTATLKTRTHLALHLLWGAARMSAEVSRIETENAGKEYADFHSHILQMSLAVVMASVGSLEGFANQLIADVNDKTAGMGIGSSTY